MRYHGIPTDDAFHRSLRQQERRLRARLNLNRRALGLLGEIGEQSVVQGVKAAGFSAIGLIANANAIANAAIALVHAYIVKLGYGERTCLVAVFAANASSLIDHDNPTSSLGDGLSGANICAGGIGAMHA